MSADVIFVKSRTPAEYPTLINLPEKRIICYISDTKYRILAFLFIQLESFPILHHYILTSYFFILGLITDEHLKNA